MVQPIIEDIKIREREIQHLHASLESTSQGRMHKKIIARLSQLIQLQDKIVMQYLESNNSSYSLLMQENFDLLTNNEITFAVTQEDWSPFRAYATALHGEIHENGYFYGKTTRTAWNILNLNGRSYPMGYSGKVNYLGEGEMKITERAYSFIGNRIPQKYVGSIDRQGNIQMKTVDTYWQHDNQTYMTNFVGDFFTGDSAKRKLFLDNKNKMLQHISEFRKSMLL